MRSYACVSTGRPPYVRAPIWDENGASGEVSVYTPLALSLSKVVSAPEHDPNGAKVRGRRLSHIIYASIGRSPTVEEAVR